MHSKALLESFSQRLFVDHGLVAVTAAELEFYVHDLSAEALETLWRHFRDEVEIHHLPLEKIEREQGEGQYEIALKPQSSPTATAEAIAQCQVLLNNLAESLGGEVDFSAKPIADQPASGLHFHLHLQNKAGENIYTKHDSAMSPTLEHSIGGLLALLPETMPAFAPDEASYARFTPRGQTPTTISWGANNRTVAVRLPDSGYIKRIEHRVAGADANPLVALSAILAGVLYGLDQHLPLSAPQIFGDATLPDYHLTPLPKTLTEAREALAGAAILPRAFPELSALLQATSQMPQRL